MAGRIIAGAVILLPGVILFLLGIIFVIASNEGNSRLRTGFILMGVSLPLIIPGLMLFLRGLSMSPSSIKKKILSIAAKNNGLVREEILWGPFANTEAAEEEITEMKRSGLVRTETKSGVNFYIFPGYQFKLKLKKCPYCGSDFSMKSNLETCPSCGGDLKFEDFSSSDQDDKFSMDM